MRNPIETQILDAEERLRLAMLHSDVSTLDKLLDPDLIFTNHLGQVFSKQDDLAVHKSEEFEITRLSVSDRQIKLNGKTAVVSAQVHLAGSYEGVPCNSRFRFTRVWAFALTGRWQVIAGHSSALL